MHKKIPFISNFEKKITKSSWKHRIIEFSLGNKLESKKLNSNSQKNILLFKKKK